jgi:autotransporter-associated beta strand protein
MSLTKRGSGTLTLRSNHSHTGGTTIEDGSLVLGLVGTTNNSIGSVGSGPLTLLGDAVVTNAWYGTQLPFSAPITIPEGSEPVIQTGRNIRFSGALNGSGTLTLLNQTVVGNTFEITGAWASFGGALRIQSAGANSSIRTIFNGGSFNGFDAASLELIGANTINPITNSGGNTFSIGALTSSSNDAILNGGSAGAPNYTVGGLNQSTVFAGKIQGNARLTKIGSGTLTLSGASTHNGTTTVNAGSLILRGSFTTSPTTVASGATLGGSGSMSGTLALSNGAILEPDGVLSTGALTSAATILRMDLSNSVNGANDRIAVTGNATLTGAHSLVFQAKDASLGPGSYPLISTTGTLTASGATFSHNLVNSPRQTFAIQASANALNLVVTGAPATLVWSGTPSIWDVAASSSWLNGAAGDVFHDGDAVTFTDAASNGNISLAATVSPRDMLVNNVTRAFSLGGSPIAGSGILRKSGSGTLTLTSSNNFTGGTILDTGTLILGNSTANAGALGTGIVTLNGGILRMFSAGNNTHAGTLPNALHVAGTARFDVAPRGGFSGNVTGNGTLEYRTGYVRGDVTGDWSAFSGQLNVTTSGSGDFRIASNYSWPGLPNASVHLAASTYLYLSGIVNSGAGTTISLGSLSGASGSFLRGGPTGDRTLTYRIGGRNTDSTYAGNIGEQGSTTITALTKTGTGVWTLSGSCSHRGTTIVESGTLRLVSGANITQTTDLSVRSGATLDLAGAAVTAGGITVADGSTLIYRGGTLNGEASLGGSLVADLSGVSAGQEFIIIQNPASTPVSGIFEGKPEGSLLTSGDRSFRLSYAGGDGNDVSLIALSAQQSWRHLHFGSTQNAGAAADSFDANGDGESNLMEFASGQSPQSRSIVNPNLNKNGNVLRFSYSRSKAALSEGFVFTVEWNDTLESGKWSQIGVSEQIQSDNGTMQSVQATMGTSTTSRRFARLRVTAPAP